MHLARTRSASMLPTGLKSGSFLLPVKRHSGSAGRGALVGCALVLHPDLSFLWQKQVLSIGIPERYCSPLPAAQASNPRDMRSASTLLSVRHRVVPDAMTLLVSVV
jgi:hypothetical protein